MAFKTPPEIAAAGTAVGEKKAKTSADKLIVAGFLGGAYIAFGGLLAIVVSAGINPDIFGGLTTLFTGAVFSLGLILVLIAGSELLTGNMALVLLGNLIGSLFVAYVLAVKTGVIAHDEQLARLGQIATAKAIDETDLQVFLRAIGCNWLVCLAVWMSLSAEQISGKILAIFFPIMAFVAMGFDHVVANMFFLPAAIFAGVPEIGWGDVLMNWLFAFLGNFVGAVIFVGGFYWYLYARPDESAAKKASGRDMPGDQPLPEHRREGVTIP